MANPDMTATVAAYGEDRVLRELAFANAALDLQHRENCEWFACLLERRCEQLTTAATAPLESLCVEIKTALEGESNDAEHDALVSVSQHLGIT